LKPTADVSAGQHQSRGARFAFGPCRYGMTQPSELPLVGTHNIYNALAATAVGARAISPLK